MASSPTAPRVLIVGARTGSLGQAIATALHRQYVSTYTAGIATEPIHLDCDDNASVYECFADVRPTHVVCTVGVNRPEPFYADHFEEVAREHWEVNFLKPMRLLNLYEDWLGGLPGSYVAVSSNSAVIARSASFAYCSSKAALSMGLRCAARDATRAGLPLRVWGYEPGALVGTPMTNEVARGLGKDVPMSRMLTRPAGLPVAAVARRVAGDLLDAGELLHGSVVRLDNGEQ